MTQDEWVMAMIEVAERLARELHAEQRDKAGAPYVGHLERVVANLVRRWPDATGDEIAAAWLHDSIEDTSVEPSDLIRRGISARAVEIVERLTRPQRVTYLEWISALAREGDISAIRVKLADNEDNSDPVRVAALPGGNEMLETRYRPARAILENAVAEATR